MNALRQWWQRFTAAHFFRTKSYEVSPCDSAWWAYGVIHAEDLDHIADFGWLRLPVYRWEENWRYRREYCWHQWVIVFHGREGFELQTWPCVEKSQS